MSHLTSLRLSFYIVRYRPEQPSHVEAIKTSVSQMPGTTVIMVIMCEYRPPPLEGIIEGTRDSVSHTGWTALGQDGENNSPKG